MNRTTERIIIIMSGLGIGMNIGLLLHLPFFAFIWLVLIVLFSVILHVSIDDEEVEQ